MPTPADQRLLELLEKWLNSLDLHIKYSTLDDASYWRVQPWVEHQRPSRWIIDVARQKTAALKAQVEERVKMGDAKFSDALELMIFLANLVGSQHIERFIPLAEADSEQAVTLTPAPPPPPPPPPSARTAQTVALASAPAPAPAPAPATALAPATAPDAAAASAAAAAPTVAAPILTPSQTATREMPRFLREQTQAPPPVAMTHVARSERRAPAARRPAPSPSPPPPKPAKAVRGAPDDAARAQVIADAERLLQWGRKWFELPELIARMADRPALAEVRRILKESKPLLDKTQAR